MKHTVFSKVANIVAMAVLAAPTFASATWYVNGVTGNDQNSCKSPLIACKTIDHAISLASSGDSILVSSGTYKENLSIAKSLRVMGSGANMTIVDGGGTGLVFSILSGANVTLSGMTIRNGFSTPYGGGVASRGTLILNNSTVSGNVVGGVGGVHLGGGLYNEAVARMTINNSTIFGNTAGKECRYPPCFIEGGGIYNGPSGELTINNSTISGNSAPIGSGVYNIRGTVTISNTTISRNRGDGGIAADAVVGWGGRSP